MSRGGVANLVRLGLMHIERTMLSDRSGPVQELLETGFVADDPSTYCPRCGKDIGPNEFVEGTCSSCRKEKLPWGGVVRLGPYEPHLREPIHNFKFDRWHTVGEHLGRALGAAVAERLHVVAEQAGEPLAAITSRSIVVPVPMSFLRRASRGIDHANCLARAVANGSGLPMQRWLVRQHRPTQTGLSMAARRKNQQRSMKPRIGPDQIGSPRVVVLVDDVMTTGATLVEACRAIRALAKARPGDAQEPPAILVAVVAVSGSRSRKAAPPPLVDVLPRSEGVLVQKK
ncbi:MAG: ComF family protein [Phycisphaerales bacterium]|nr:ComF family protein [Phycisphaerales bacterium]